MTSYTVEVVVPGDCNVEGVDGDGDVTVSFAVDEDQYVLGAARDGGVWLPADCQQGWCTTCAAELLAGEVDQSDARRYFDEDREADLFLPCTAKPRSDLRLRACQHGTMLDHRADHDLPPGDAKRR